MRLATEALRRNTASHCACALVVSSRPICVAVICVAFNAMGQSACLRSVNEILTN
jgi:hypothetical protein